MACLLCPTPVELREGMVDPSAGLQTASYNVSAPSLTCLPPRSIFVLPPPPVFSSPLPHSSLCATHPPCPPTRSAAPRQATTTLPRCDSTGNA